ncbi:MAG: nuclear transport factor 2 family protein [Planctomycetota bacterium]
MTFMKSALAASAVTLSLGSTASAQTAADAAEAFFDRYNEQNVPAMVDLFEPEGTVVYVPFALTGPVEEIGPGSWGVLIDAFPDLRNEVRSIRETANGRTAYVDVDILGTQTKDVFGVPNSGQSYDLRHLFVIETNEEGEITQLTSFWDNADWFRQLGKTTLD